LRRVLVIDDSPEARAIIHRCLRGQYETLEAENGAQGFERAVACLPDLILLDVGLPDFDGFDVCTRMRSHPALESTPIIFLTGRGEAHDKVKAFKLGADDYVEKPFDILELRARIEARLRTTNPIDRQLRFSDMQLDPLRQSVTLRLPDREWVCDLTPNEFRLLLCLASRRGEVVSRDSLMDFVWPGVTITTRTIDTHISNLRAKLTPHGKAIAAVRGVGYRMAKPDEFDQSEE
jgi:DNA-binding response OmpR family regulator